MSRLTERPARVSVNSRAVCWPDDRSCPQISLPVEQAEAEGLTHKDTIPADWDREHGVLILHVRDAAGGDDDE